MKDVVKKMLDHPFATCMLVTAASNGIARIVGAARGNEVGPVNSINIGGKVAEEEKENT